MLKHQGTQEENVYSTIYPRICEIRFSQNHNLIPSTRSWTPDQRDGGDHVNEREQKRRIWEGPIGCPRPTTTESTHPEPNQRGERRECRRVQEVLWETGEGNEKRKGETKARTFAEGARIVKVSECRCRRLPSHPQRSVAVKRREAGQKIL